MKRKPSVRPTPRPLPEILAILHRLQEVARQGYRAEIVEVMRI